MITPGFFGLFNAYRGLMTTQNALSTINHNITNSTTPGYSRQRVETSAYYAYNTPMFTQMTAGQIGQGPTVERITRSRDSFLDAQYRQSSGKSGLYSTMLDSLQQIEGILNEPSTGSLNSVVQNFFDAAQELSLHPEAAAPRSNFIQQAIDMVNVFQQQAIQLSDLRRNLVGDPLVPTSFNTSQLAINVQAVNTKLEAVANVNRNIVSIKASGAEPNDLMDQRDKLLDELSELVDLQITSYDNGQIDLRIANQLMIRGVDQVDSLEAIENPGPLPDPDDVPALVRTVTGLEVLNDGAGDDITAGKIKGILDMGGNSPTLSTVRGVLGKLDLLLDTIVTEVNALQAAGRDQYGNAAPPDLFVANAALNPGQALNIFHWEVNSTVTTDPKLLAAAIDDPLSGFAGTGDGRNALLMAQLRDQAFAALGTGVVDYLNGTVSKLGIDSQSYKNSSASQTNLVQSVELRRQSISGVSMDEETIDLLRYQRAFEATSKSIQVFDQVAQTIIDLI